MRIDLIKPTLGCALLLGLFLSWSCASSSQPTGAQDDSKQDQERIKKDDSKQAKDRIQKDDSRQVQDRNQKYDSKQAQEDDSKQFQERIQKYVALQKKAVSTVPPIGKDVNDAALIAKHQQQIAQAIRTQRPNAMPGDIFTPGVKQM